MRLFLLTLAAMTAFAANSLLNRAALSGDAAMDPAAFTAVRMISGALMLGVLVALRGGAGRLPGAGQGIAATALLAYAVAFSFAYVSLDAGLGALVLFGTVQVTMFGGALLASGRPPRRRWIGAAMGLLGLTLLFLPGADRPEPWGLILMVVAGIAWGVYSLKGQRAGDPLLATAGNFLWAAPVALGIWLAMGAGGMAPLGLLLAVLSGALASGLGYAIWYAALPGLEATEAAVAQLSVPVLAALGGILLLGEAVTPVFVGASGLILGGILVATFSGRRRA